MLMSHENNNGLKDHVRKKLMDSKLFDEEYYLSYFTKEIEDPLEHYLTKGYKKGYNPSSEFDTECYLKNNKDVAKKDINPLYHYVIFPNNSNRKVKYDLSLSDFRKFKKTVYNEGLFDDEYYLLQAKDSTIKDPLDDYIKNGSEKGLNPSCLFNTNNYLKNNPDVKEAGKNPLLHYVIYALNNYRKVNHDLSLPQLRDLRKKAYQECLFDDKYYLSQINDEEIPDPLEHYLSVGYTTGLNPSEYFDTENYMKNHEDVDGGEVNPLIYYILNELDSDVKVKHDLSLKDYKIFRQKVYSEGLFNDEYYLGQCQQKPEHPLDDYLTRGCKQGLNPSQYFDTNCYQQNNKTAENPLIHYVLYAQDSDIKVKYDLSLNDYKKFCEEVYARKLFDDEYYQKQLNKEVEHPLDDYVYNGADNGLNPSENFDTICYTRNNKILNKQNPLIHYVLYAQDSDIKVKYDLSLNDYKKFCEEVYARKLFDDEYYQKQLNKEVEHPLDDYVYNGADNGLNPSENFDTNCYTRNNKISNNINPLIHYIFYGNKTNTKIKYDLSHEKYQEFKKTIKEKELFDEEHYLKQYPNTKILNPLDHYMTTGCHESKNPSEIFNTQEYLKLNPDVAKTGINPLIHFVFYGINADDRKFNFNLTYNEYQNLKTKAYTEKLFDEEYYQSQLEKPVKDAFAHYLREGYKKGLNPSYLFNTQEYLKNNSDVKEAEINPLQHFIQYATESNRKFNFNLTYKEYKNIRQEAYELGLLEDEYYQSQCTTNITDTLSHYIAIGCHEGLNPSYLFNTEEYLEHNDTKGENPLLYFIKNGKNTNNKFNFDLTYEQYCDFKEKAYAEKLFDDDYYLTVNSDVKTTQPLAHYLSVGYKQGLNPSIYFDTNCYLENSQDVANLGINPFIHYVRQSFNSERKVVHELSLSKYKEFRKTVYSEGLFNDEYYLRQYKHSKIIDPLDHYLRLGWKQESNPSPLFNTSEYLKVNWDVAESDVNPLLHFVRYAMEHTRHFNFGVSYQTYKEFLEIANREELFDEEYYLGQCEEENIISPICHYLSVGYKKGYDPSRYFSTKQYLKRYPDVADDGRNPLIHYCLYGIEEDRLVKHNITLSELKVFYEKVYDEELFDEEYYLKQRSKKYVEDSLDDYVEFGSKEGLNPSVYFDSNNYLENNPDVFYLNKNPLVHYVVYSLNSGRKVNHDLTLKQYKKFREYVYHEGLFDDEYYTSQVEWEVADPLEDYLNRALEENLDPSEKFSTTGYIEEHTDIKKGQNPLIHYVMNFLDVYETIANSEMFNEEFYFTHAEEVELDESADPILHYITEGAQLGLNPSAFFSTKKYLEMYPDVEEEKVNPLYHYIKYGRRQSRDSFMVLSNHLQKFDKRYQIYSCTNMIEALEKKISIIIPIYNAYDQTRDCITSVLRNTHINYELILINDCSTDERIDELLTSLEAVPNIKVIRNTKNQGFVKNVNLGMTLSQHDVVLLNSDTVVTPHWLSHLVYCAYSSNEIGTVTPYSNASDISVTDIGPERDFYEINKTGYKIDRLSYNLNMEAPTGNGFCLFIKRELIDEIGLFDESFGMGYGEETDFTFRAYKQGWLNIRDDAVFIYHRRHASFNEDTSNTLKQQNKKLLEERYDDLYELWDEFANSESLADSLYRIKLHFNDRKNPERILYVTTMENERPVLDEDYHIIADEYECFILVLAAKQIKLGVLREGRFVLYDKWTITSKWDKNTFVRLYLNMLLNLKLDIVYVKYFYNYYNPNNQNISVFIRLLSMFEIPALYEATTSNDALIEEIKELLYPMQSLEELIEEKSNEIDFSKYKMVVYTALTGDYDELVTPTVRNPNFDYICFTDNPELKSNFWTIKAMEDLDLDPIRKARRYKILPHKYLQDYDYSLWIDANFDIIGDVEEYINKRSKKHKLLAIKHDMRDDIYEEAQACIDLEKDDHDTITRQVERYRDEKYPEHNGLIASGILFRNHNDKEVKQVMNDWYSEVYNYSRRDQLSFNYVCWKNNFQYEESPEFYFKNQYFQRLYHSRENLMKLQYDEETVNRILESFNNKTSIIIPVYNAYEETRDCIESVKKYTTIPYEILIIDDCSTDERLKEYYSSIENDENIRIIFNEENLGFVKNINKGFEQTHDDVVILNSDTEVTPKWLQKLKITAYAHENIATVTPFSNNAGAFSVPVHDEDNEIDPELGVNSIANIIEKLSTKEKLFVPTGNGFCMYIRREAIYAVGFFDPIFGRGYCEENDFCMRLLGKGWTHAIDTSTYILHKHNVSFSSEKEKLFENNRKILDIKYPDYSLKLLDLLRSYDFKDIRDNISLTLESESKQEFDKKRILYLIHEGNGGTLHTSIELMGNLPENVESYILTAGKEEIKLYKYSKIGKLANTTDNDDEFLQHLSLLANWTIKSDYTIKDVSNSEFRRIYFNILHILKIDLVHIRHLIRHSFDMPYLAKQLGIPVILSFHDFYYVCPSHNLIDDNDEYCAGHCSNISSNRGQCNINDGLNAPILKSFVHTWRQNVRQMLDCCDGFVTTSKSAYDIYTEFYPELLDKPFDIIEHGRDIKTPDKITEIPVFRDNERIRILFPGHINVNKGGWLIRSIKDCDKQDRLEFHYMGNLHPKFKLEDIGTHHGYYKRSEFCKEVQKIKPHFIALLSIWPETYCHTLTESWGCGIPVLTLDIGALGERVHENGGGFFIENDAKKAYDKILSIADNRAEYIRTVREISGITFKSTKQMADEYMELYSKYVDFD